MSRYISDVSRMSGRVPAGIPSEFRGPHGLTHHLLDIHCEALQYLTLAVHCPSGIAPSTRSFHDLCKAWPGDSRINSASPTGLAVQNQPDTCETGLSCKVKLRSLSSSQTRSNLTVAPQFREFGRKPTTPSAPLSFPPRDRDGHPSRRTMATLRALL